MKKRYLFAGLALAAVAAVVVILLGSHSTSPTAATASSAQAGPSLLPASHSSASQSPMQVAMADTSASLKKKIAQLEADYAQNPKSPTAILALAQAYFLAARFDEATKLYNSDLALRPNDPAATVGLAMIWHAEGQDARAISAVNSVLAAAPENQAAHFTLAIIYFSQQNISAARAQWQKAANIDPTSQIGKESREFVELIDNGSATAPSD